MVRKNLFGQLYRMRREKIVQLGTLSCLGRPRGWMDDAGCVADKRLIAPLPQLSSPAGIPGNPTKSRKMPLEGEAGTWLGRNRHLQTPINLRKTALGESRPKLSQSHIHSNSRVHSLGIYFLYQWECNRTHLAVTVVLQPRAKRIAFRGPRSSRPRLSTKEQGRQLQRPHRNPSR